MNNNTVNKYSRHGAAEPGELGLHTHLKAGRHRGSAGLAAEAAAVSALAGGGARSSSRPGHGAVTERHDFPFIPGPPRRFIPTPSSCLPRATHRLESETSPASRQHLHPQIQKRKKGKKQRKEKGRDLEKQEAGRFCHSLPPRDGADMVALTDPELRLFCDRRAGLPGYYAGGEDRPSARASLPLQFAALRLSCAPVSPPCLNVPDCQSRPGTRSCLLPSRLELWEL